MTALILVFLVFRRACDGMVIFARTQLAYLSLARLFARLESSQEWLVRGTRRRARERQPAKNHWTLLWSLQHCGTSCRSNALSATPYEEFENSSDHNKGQMTPSRHSERSPGATAWPEGALSTSARIRLVCLRPASEKLNNREDNSE